MHEFGLRTQKKLFGTIELGLVNGGLLTVVQNTGSRIDGPFGNTVDGTVHIESGRGFSDRLPSTLTVASGFVNEGVIELTQLGTRLCNPFNCTLAGQSALIVETGTLVNMPSGLIDVTPGDSGGSRVLTTELSNLGTVNVNWHMTLGRGDANHVNSGTIDMGGVTLTLTGIAFLNAIDGLIVGTGTLDISSIMFTNQGQVDPGIILIGS